MDKMKVHSSCLRDKSLKNVPEYVPMELLNEEQAERNHSQSLSRLNERGGMGIAEILDNIHKRRLSFRGETQADVDELNEIIERGFGKPITIELSLSQTKKFHDWQKLFGEELPNIGMTGGHFGLEIIFTSIGLVIYGKSWKGDKIDLTEL